MRGPGERNRAAPGKGKTIMRADKQASDACCNIREMHGGCVWGSACVATPMLDVSDVITLLHKRIALPSQGAPIETYAFRLKVDEADPLEVVGLPDKDPTEALLLR